MPTVKAILVTMAAAAIAMPTAIASADDSAATSAGTTAAKQLKQLKALKAKTAALATQAAGLERQGAELIRQGAAMTEQVAALEARAFSLERKSLPSSLPPNGPAGGVLTGTFPNPGLGFNVVNTLNIANGTIQGVDIALGGVSSTDLAAESVGGEALRAGVFREDSTPIPINPGETKEASVECPAGTQLISGGHEWLREEDGTAEIASAPNPFSPNTTWSVRGRVDRGQTSEENALFAIAFCL